MGTSERFDRIIKVSLEEVSEESAKAVGEIAAEVLEDALRSGVELPDGFAQRMAKAIAERTGSRVVAGLTKPIRLLVWTAYAAGSDAGEEAALRPAKHRPPNTIAALPGHARDLSLEDTEEQTPDERRAAFLPPGERTTPVV